MIPISMANENPFKASPPNTNNMINTKNTVAAVTTVRLNVLLIALLIMVTSFLSVRRPVRNSRIRSNTITVSLIEYPSNVNKAAIKC